MNSLEIYKAAHADRLLSKQPAIPTPPAHDALFNKPRRTPYQPQLKGPQP